eukprot:FR738079.1.p1 GENE.FR738079.1~~FR738079.1.p1  ORF type:complete len:114 (+),score=11.93 FR738079.1:232-573(+)
MSGSSSSRTSRTTSSTNQGDTTTPNTIHINTEESTYLLGETGKTTPFARQEATCCASSRSTYQRGIKEKRALDGQQWKIRDPQESWNRGGRESCDGRFCCVCMKRTIEHQVAL